jgi:hypothetical protein
MVTVMTNKRQVRAVARIAITWGVAFSAIGATALATGLVFRVLPPQLSGVAPLLAILTRAFVGGAVAGTVFATLFARAERNRTLATLSSGRAALWGFLGAALPAAVTLGLGAARIIPVGVMGAACLAYGLIGGSLSLAMVRIAKRAPAIAGDAFGPS